jgi:hypothetical protein
VTGAAGFSCATTVGFFTCASARLDASQRSRAIDAAMLPLAAAAESEKPRHAMVPRPRMSLFMVSPFRDVGKTKWAGRARHGDLSQAARAGDQAVRRMMREGERMNVRMVLQSRRLLA